MIKNKIPDAPQAKENPFFDIDLIRSLLISAAAKKKMISYSELLMLLGYRFTRPKMRAICKVLDRIDHMGALSDEPELAALVVRESDGLPGQGWWIGRADYAGPWTGSEARAYLSNIQAMAFAHWQPHIDQKNQQTP
jgi:hypothetical protein